jgi:choline dehydrogenase-like flavoprotein
VPASEPPPAELTAAQRATLAAVVGRVVAGAESLAPALDAAALVEARLARMPVHKRADLRLVLDLFGSRAAALVTLGAPVPFARLGPARQDAMLRRWAAGRVPLQRTVFQALRRLALATWYAEPEVQRAIGYLGALHDRAPVVPWEGPVAGVPSDEEPIARGAPPEHHDTLGAADHPHPDAARRAAAPQPRALALATGAGVPGTVVTGAGWRGDVRLDADAVVIGSGAGGAVAACRLAEAGLRVVILEEGGFWTADDLTEREGEMTERLYAEQGLRATEDLAFSLLQGESVGGSTTVNWLIMLRPPAHVLHEWGRRFGLADLNEGALAPVLDLVEAETHTRAVPDDAHSPNNRALLRGAARLGWRARAGRINARGCVRAGFCGQGCRYDARQGAQVVYLPRALAAGATLYGDARAERIEVAERDTGRGRPPRKRVVATVRDRATGRARGTLTVDAPLVVCAGGAIGTPALLQRSGLGGGGVGRWLRLHPTTAVTATYDEPMHGSAGIPLSTLCDEFASAGPGGYGFWIECPPVHPMLASVATSGMGAAHAALMREFPHTGTLISLVRDGADPALSNGSVRVDRAGRTRIRYRLGPTDARHVREGMMASARLHLAAGAREVRTLHTDPVVVRHERDVAAVARRSTAPNDLALFSAHVNGTCRLGVDPRASGCAPTGERHGARGVYVADGALLPTGLGVNPQETIMALATVVARGIADAWR